MKLRDRAGRLAVLCSLLAVSSLAGCGGSSESSSADSSAAATPTPPPPTPAAPPPASASNDPNSGAGNDGGMANSGMANSGMANSGMANSGMANSGMADSSGMNSGGAQGGMGMGMGMGMMPSGSGNPGAGYGQSSMGGMAPPGAGSGGFDLSALLALGAPAPNSNANMGMGMGPGMYGGGQQPAPVDPAPSEDEDYLTKAKYAFASGKEAVAEQYFYAHLLAHDDQAPALLEQVRWSPGGRKLTTTVRFGVGVQLEASSGIDDYRPIGHSQMAGNNAAGGGAAMPSGYGMGPGSGPSGAQGNKAEKTLDDLTGKFGEELVTAFETAWDNGDFGTAFKDVEPIAPPQAAPANNPYGSGMSGMMSSGGMASPMMAPGSGGMPGAPGSAATATGELRMKAVAGKTIVPDLLFLGTGNASELEEKARKEGIDYLFLFEVEVKSQRGLVHNDTRLRLVSAKDGSSVGATSTLNNLKVDRAAATKSDTDDLAKQIGNLFRKVETLKLTDLPKLEPVHAQARIKSLLEKKENANVLQTLVEARLFNSLGLLDDEERDAAYQLALGGAGVALTSGPVEDRHLVLDPLLPTYR